MSASAAASAANAAARHISNSNVMTRAVYLARLRRAFLLRVHPDRFSTSCPSIRQGQAVLVKALLERFRQPDFTTWQQSSSSSLSTHSSTSTSTLYHHHHHHQSPIRLPNTGDSLFRFTMERRRDGALLQCQLRLDQPVEAILQSMTETLRQSGLTSAFAASSSLLPPVVPPPPSASSALFSSHHLGVGDDNGANSAASWPFSSCSSPSSSSGIDHRYNVVSNQGRNLHYFLANLDRDDQMQRQAARTNAQAAALQVRRLYQFSAVDATSLAWSSASVAVLLQRLQALHHEHSHKFHVTSFYPLRLVFWPDDFVDYSSDAALNVHGGGVLSLNPAATPLQWLEKIQLVTLEKLQQVVQLRNQVQEMTRCIQDQIIGGNVQLKKGFSCSPVDYFDFLSRLAASTAVATTTNNTSGSSGGALVLEPQLIIVESQQACRGGSASGGRARMTVTKTGAIQVSASSGTIHEPRHHDTASATALVELLRDAIHNTNSTLGQRARERRALAKHDQEQALEWSRRAVWQLGLQRVYRTSNRVSHADLVHCLDRLLAWPHEQQQQQQPPNGGHDHHDDDDDTTNSSMKGIRERLLRTGLTGNGLGIASTGQFCHLADDGSIVIPHDWR